MSSSLFKTSRRPVIFIRRCLGWSLSTLARVARLYSLDGRNSTGMKRAKNLNQKRSILLQAHSADLCFLTSIPLEQVIVHLQACEVPLVEGPVNKTGAAGPLRSLYV